MHVFEIILTCLEVMDYCFSIKPLVKTATAKNDFITCNSAALLFSLEKRVVLGTVVDFALPCYRTCNSDQ